MRYLIDGHNLIDQLPDINLSDPDDEIRLVRRLKSFCARQRCRCTVVFDRGLPGGKARGLSNSQVEVVFAHSGTSADRVIIARLRQVRDRQGITVVSGDQSILAEAQRLKIRAISSVEFARRMAQQAVSPNTDDKPSDRPLTGDEVSEWERLFGSGEK
ncbi:MAG: NYN domain-containing protein [Anaerolineae bacterium]